MKRRCKPGDRARILSLADSGKVVLVLRKYHGEKIKEATWHEGFFPWVVLSLGGPLQCAESRTNTRLPPEMVIVIDDADLEPLHDDDPADSESTQTDRLRESPITDVISFKAD